MKIYLRLLFFIVVSFSLSGCFELIEDTTINEDGSGVYKLTLNMSASQTRLNSLMALDSIDGKKVPSETEIKQELIDFVARMNESDGISNAKGNFSAENWILKLSCSFDSLPAIKNSIYLASRKWSSKNEDRQQFENIHLNFNDNKYTRKFSSNMNEKFQQEVRKDEDFGKLSEGKCVFIQRFDQTISSTSNEKVRIAKNKKASMLMISPAQIIQNPSVLDYSVKLNP